MSQHLALILAALALIVACYALVNPGYQIATSHFNTVYRLDTRTGLITYYELDRDSNGPHEIARTSD